MCYICHAKRPKIKQKEAGFGPFKKKLHDANVDVDVGAPMLTSSEKLNLFTLQIFFKNVNDLLRIRLFNTVHRIVHLKFADD